MSRHITGAITVGKLLLVLLLVAVGGLSYYLYTIYSTGVGRAPELSLSVPEPTVPPGITRAPTPYLLLPQGRQAYQIRTGSSNEPMATRIIVDPLDARKGESQTVSLEAGYTNPIESIDVTLITDNTQKTYSMTLSEGAATKGTWSSTHAIEDDHEVIYTMKFVIKYNGGKESVVDFPIR